MMLRYHAVEAMAYAAAGALPRCYAVALRGLMLLPPRRYAHDDVDR